MNKIRVIDLLNKIANNEELPKKIKYKNNIYEYDGETQNYCRPINMIWDFLIGEDIVALLNDEVEIIEEDKKIEQIYTLNNESDEFRVLANKINELIDEINNLKEK